MSIPPRDERSFLEHVAEIARRTGATGLVAAHERLLSDLKKVGVPPSFDGRGELEATYTVRAASPEPVASDQWHILRVNANGTVMAMLNHIRNYVSANHGLFYQRQLRDMIDPERTEAPRLSTTAASFAELDTKRVAWIVRAVLDAIESFPLAVK